MPRTHVTVVWQGKAAFPLQPNVLVGESSYLQVFYIFFTYISKNLIHVEVTTKDSHVGMVEVNCWSWFFQCRPAGGSGLARKDLRTCISGWDGRLTTVYFYITIYVTIFYYCIALYIYIYNMCVYFQYCCNTSTHAICYVYCYLLAFIDSINWDRKLANNITTTMGQLGPTRRLEKWVA